LIVRALGDEVIEMIEDGTGFDGAFLVFDIEREKSVAIHGEVEDDCVVDGLAGETGTGAPGEEGEVVIAGVFDHAEDVLGIFREDDAERFDLVDARVGGVEHTVVFTEAYFAFDDGCDVFCVAGYVGVGEIEGIRIEDVQGN